MCKRLLLILLTGSTKGNRFNPDIGCGTLKSGVFPHPDNCAWYFNCSVRPDAVQETYYSGHVMECPYPQLFSVDSMQCEDFEDVQCRGRYEPKSPCECSHALALSQHVNDEKKYIVQS